MKLAEYISYISGYLPNRSDALEFVSSVTGVSYSGIPLRLSEDITPVPGSGELLKRIIDGEPLAYVINNKNFYGMDIYVDESVLIPRPETEILVEKALELAGGREKLRILDICTGSGCIPAALLSNLPDAQAVCVDISPAALATAEKNLKTYKLYDRAELLQADALRLEEAVSDSFDIVTCNPPYLSESEWEASDKSLKYEPKNALSAGSDALVFYKKLMDMAPKLCNKNGGMLFEAGLGQRQLLRAEGYAEEYLAVKDYQQIERVLIWINS